MENKYDWAENPSKLQRAIEEVKDGGKKFENEEEEEAVKTVYRRLLGKIKGEPARGSVEDTNKVDIAEKLEEAHKEGYEKGYEAGIKDANKLNEANKEGKKK